MYIDRSKFYALQRYGRAVPFYSDNADYNTNAPSYYDYLARFNELLNAIIDQVNQNTADIAEIKDKLDDLQKLIDEINERLDLIDDQINEINNKIDNLFNIIDNVFTKTESSQLFQKTVYNRTVKNFNILNYTSSTFAQLYMDYVTKYINEFYPTIVGGITVDVYSDNLILLSLVKTLILDTFGESVSYSAYKIQAKMYSNNYAQPFTMNILPNGTNEIYQFIGDNYGTLTGTKTPNENLFKGANLFVKGININGDKYIPERQRTMLGFEGVAHLFDNSSINLALNGYDTGQIEKVTLRFMEFDPINNEVVPNRSYEWSITNAINALGYTDDGFYGWHCIPFFHDDGTYTTKTFDLNYGETTLNGNSGISKNRIYLRNVDILIFADRWTGLPKGSDETRTNILNYPIIETSKLSGNELEIFMLRDNGKKCFDIYDLDSEQLIIFKEKYKKYVKGE